MPLSSFASFVFYILCSILPSALCPYPALCPTSIFLVRGSEFLERAARVVSKSDLPPPCQKTLSRSSHSLFHSFTHDVLKLRAMSQFINDIWNSVFEPGANQSVLIATYGSLAALQATLFALLLATRSWHFVFLSIVCACLWAAIVWFVNELEAVKKVETEAVRIRGLRKTAEGGEGEGGGEEEEAGKEEKKER